MYGVYDSKMPLENISFEKKHSAVKNKACLFTSYFCN